MVLRYVFRNLDPEQAVGLADEILNHVDVDVCIEVADELQNIIAEKLIATL